MLLHGRGSLRALRQAFRPEACAAARSYISSATDDTSTAEVPAGHHGSDLSDVACNIALNRRRDLTLRQDLCLWQGDKKLSLADVLKGQRVVLVGLPDMGKVCADSHVPSYMDKLDGFKKEQIGLIAFMSISSPVQVEEFASRFALPPGMAVYADVNGGVTRMLGLETGVPLTESGPKSQRFAGVVDDGILVRMVALDTLSTPSLQCIEDSPADCSKSHAESVLDVVRTILW